MATIRVRNETDTDWYVFGEKGPQGVQGFQGHQGQPGAQGSQGVQGTQGYQGATGLKGDEGAQGSQGPQGFQGVRGFQGEQGPIGERGFQGPAGMDGADGLPGPQGATGATGPQGSQGKTGAQGAQGYQGATGSQGAQGAMGPEGLNWLGEWDENRGEYDVNDAVYYQGNAYVCIEWHVPYGFPPPNSFWTLLSQQGATGAQGAQGLAGPQGATGPQGSQGETGAQGATGATGAQGARGLTGAQGPTGPQGFQGPKGAQGSQGEVGAQGVTGPQGNQGAVGSQGSQGVVGSQGEQGPQGPSGPQGADGPQGNPGAQGATGPQGAQGLLGDVLAHNVTLSDDGALTAGTGSTNIRFDQNRIVGNVSDNPYFVIGNLINHYGIALGNPDPYGIGVGSMAAGEYLLYHGNKLYVSGNINATSGEIHSLNITGELNVTEGTVKTNNVDIVNTGLKFKTKEPMTIGGNPVTDGLTWIDKKAGIDVVYDSQTNPLMRIVSRKVHTEGIVTESNITLDTDIVMVGANGLSPIEAGEFRGTATNSLRLGGVVANDYALKSDVSPEPTWQDWTPTLTGWSMFNLTRACRFRREGNTVYFNVYVYGNSNSTGASISLPPGLPAVNIANLYWRGISAGMDNGAGLTTPIMWQISPGGTEILCYSNLKAGGWTASGKKLVAFQGFYETAGGGGGGSIGLE